MTRDLAGQPVVSLGRGGDQIRLLPQLGDGRLQGPGDLGARLEVSDQLSLYSLETQLDNTDSDTWHQGLGYHR